ncbi:branched-chain amino acid ABC transporter permease [Variovorax sp. WS11]|uniref:branched-chain amino acid ABC transporter ATP-binding protein/permease n=1 Tax=Variovorax sp. WS11 TaxID=1105204 RepID=UPI000D0DB4C6|nr:branched-chain amino acid ABC transporter ATP-binding protein/permease [Variovorax sp. WS11]NDZ17483.1 branched-chain amino acid ABC transporter ATP-binding protein/permease [Variovorax sp. WS11]PSL85982.1 branched-chain amino acid ABC transporter permease [Variovorax sp. WS11]
MAVNALHPRALGGIVLAFAALATLPSVGLPAFYDSFFYVLFFWISLATSWAILSGFAGYFSLGHAAFLGAGMYTSATLATKFGWPFLTTIPAAGVVAALLGCGIGALVFRLPRLRGELFALMTLAVTFVLATVILNTPIDGGPGVYLSGVPVPRIVESESGSVYLMGLAMCVATLLIAWRISRSRFGLGLYAISDDEDVAEVKGVPTFRYKMSAFALSAGIAGAVGGIHAIYVGFVTVGETFGIAVPLSVVLMSVLGGARHWLGPAVGATLITVALFGFASTGLSIVGRAVVAIMLIVAMLCLREGIVPSLLRRLRPGAGQGAIGTATPKGASAERPYAMPATADVAPARPAASARVVLSVEDVHKSFGGLQALRGVNLEVYEGEILGLIGPNGCGKTTLINMITGHLSLTSGSVKIDGETISGLPAHLIARRGIARTYQIPRPFAHLTTLENVELCAQFGGREADSYRQDALHWLAFCDLTHRAHALPADLNLRERKVLELARALAARPRVLLLDEVMSGLNPSEVDTAIRLVRQIRAQGTSIVFVEHLMRAVVQLSDRVAVMNEGTLLTAGRPEEVMRDERVVGIYFGHDHAAA